MNLHSVRHRLARATHRQAQLDISRRRIIMATAHTLIVEPDDGRALVLQALNAATKSIDLTIYEIWDPQIMSALESAQARKVVVRVLYNWYSFTPRMQQTDITPAIQQLTKAGIQCKQAPRTF